MVYVSQVEVTTYCNGSCVYCPVAIYRGSWDSRHMEPTLYAKILQECRQVGIKHLHLQGWGE
ncbi:MAG: radical SAM protein, partial [Pyrobaculum sp.]